MIIRELKPSLVKYLKRHNFEKKYSKQLALFKSNPLYPSLNTEKLEPSTYNLYSFRIDRKYRAIFGFHTSDEVEIVDINVHYQ